MFGAETASQGGTAPLRLDRTETNFTGGRQVAGIVRVTVARVWRVVGYLPVSVAAVAGVSWYFLKIGISRYDVFGSPVALLNPLWYVLSMVIHSGWGHFEGNMYILVPFGVLLTLFTSNRHVMGVMLVSHVLGSVVRVAVAPAVAVGSSGAALGLAAAALVRTTGYGLQNTSEEWLQTGLYALFVPLACGFLFIAVLAGGRGTTAHFIHFFAFLFGGAMEAIYVFSEYGDSGSGTRNTAPNPFQ